MRRTGWPFRIMAVLSGLILSVIGATMVLAAVLQGSNAEAARTLAPYDAGALAGSASVLLETGQRDAAAQRARQALMREPINVEALRTLGLAASFAMQEEAARDHLMLVQQLSRRDLAAQLWWIEHQVARGDIAGALTFYDQALKTSRRAGDMILPTLARASAEPLVARQLAPFLESRPAWFRLFFIQATDMAPDNTEVAALGTRLLDPGNLEDRDLIDRIIRRFGRDGQYDRAWEVFVWANEGRPQDNIINGSFEEPSGGSLFDWELTRTDVLTAEIAGRGDSDALWLIAEVGRGVVARQMLRLQPGRYELTAVVGEVPDAAIDRPTLAISCADDASVVLAPITFPGSAGAPARLAGQFDVGTSCRYQRLELTASASTQDETQAWIDDLVIRPDR